MKLQELENYINANYSKLYEECKGICREEEVVGTLRFEELRLYEGCEFCIIKTAVDHLNMPTLVMPLKDGRVMELVKLSDYILELSEGAAQVFSTEDFLEELTDYLDFGLLTDEEVSMISKWLGKEKT
ncbi:MAG: hypothetical protein J7L12_04470 [Desulfurococcales archaeon]|nr:hypothetical protein [Desulfurococcales archaeon]